MVVIIMVVIIIVIIIVGRQDIEPEVGRQDIDSEPVTTIKRAGFDEITREWRPCLYSWVDR